MKRILVVHLVEEVEKGEEGGMQALHGLQAENCNRKIEKHAWKHFKKRKNKSQWLRSWRRSRKSKNSMQANTSLAQDASILANA